MESAAVGKEGVAGKISRRKFLAAGSLALLGAGPWGRARASLNPSFDLVIKNAWIVDGTGAPAWKGDLGTKEDLISAIGRIDSGQGARVLEAEGLCVSPGFIDIHSHSDFSILSCPLGESRVFQGITTELTGNCGDSAAPLAGTEKQLRAVAEELGYPVSWTDVASYLCCLEESGLSLNQALLLGQGTLRQMVAGHEDRPLSTAELEVVLDSVERGMDQGAFGLSTGLEYVPGSYTPTDEIAAMARVVARMGGLYATHIRSEAKGVLSAVNEAIQIGRQAGVRVEISHFKCAGRPNWSKQEAALQLLESARRSGVDVLADAYPYRAYSTGLRIFLPGWAQEGGSEALLKRLRDDSLRDRLENEVELAVASDPGGYDGITVVGARSKRNRWLIGKNIEQISDKWGIVPSKVILRILEEEGNAPFIGFGMKRENVGMVLSHPLVMIGSDGAVMSPVGRAAEQQTHPRSYGTCPRILGEFCRERKLFDLTTAIKKMTSMPADQIGLKDRGRIGKGKKADLVLFDPATVQDEATFNEPHRYPTGIPYVLVNGTFVIDQGKHTEEKPGRVLRS